MRRLMILFLLLLSQAFTATISGLHWNVDNNAGNSDVRLVWGTPPPRWPLTILYKYSPHPHNDYYAVFWYTSDDENYSGQSYYNGGTPYPLGGSGSTHYWEIAHDGTDSYTDLVVKDVWYPQAFSSQLDISGDLQYVYYWAVDSGTTSTWTQTASTTAGALSACACTATTWSGGGYVIELGASPWRRDAVGSGTNDETLYGVIRDIQIFDTVLSASEIATEMATESNAAITEVGQRHLWYSNMDPIPTDVTDKSGSGNDPTWANANRPIQWDSVVASGDISPAFRATLLGVGR